MTKDSYYLLKDAINDIIDSRIKILETPVNGCDMCFDGKIFFHSVPGQPKHKCFLFEKIHEYTFAYDEIFDELHPY